MVFRLAALMFLMPAFALAEVELRFDDGSVGIVSNGRVLFGDNRHSVLYEPGDAGILVLNREQRTWMRLEPGFAGRMAAQIQAQMEQVLASVPPEQRAAVEAQLEGVMPQSPTELPEVNIRKTGATDSVAGYACEEAEVSFGGGRVEEVVCIADAEELGISVDDFDALIAAMRGMAEIATLDPDASPQADFGEVGGVPIRTTGGMSGNDSELVSVDTRNIDTSRFDIPAGYREVTVDEMMAR